MLGYQETKKRYKELQMKYKKRKSEYLKEIRLKDKEIERLQRQKEELQINGLRQETLFKLEIERLNKIIKEKNILIGNLLERISKLQ